MAQPVETATDNRHTHKDLGLVMVNVYGFVFQESANKHTNKHTDRRTDATKRIISPASRSIIKYYICLKWEFLSSVHEPCLHDMWQQWDHNNLLVHDTDFLKEALYKT